MEPQKQPRQTNNLIEWAESVYIEIDFPPYDELFGTNRQKVNYLRHECTSYEWDLAATKHQTGKHEVYHIIRGRALKLIARHYPELSGEAHRQGSS